MFYLQFKIHSNGVLLNSVKCKNGMGVQARCLWIWLLQEQGLHQIQTKVKVKEMEGKGNS